MKMLDLFSGIGGFSLAAHWAGIETVAFCEQDKYCQQVLKKHWPTVPIHDDIFQLNVDTLANLLYNQSLKLKEVIEMANKRKDYSEAVIMYERGLSIGQVADFYEITRQAMWMILKRRGCEFRDQTKFGKENHFNRGGSNASDKAQNLLETAIQQGIIQRKTHCEKCGSSPMFKNGRTGIQAHHFDYNKPLDVIWFCQKCHHEWHKNNKAVNRKEVMPNELNEETTIDIVSGGFP
jgi:hypothetical protein